MKQTDVIALFRQAIATYEGFYLNAKQAALQKVKLPTLAQKNCNPGNLRSWGTRPVVNGYAQFPNNEEGFKALDTQIRKVIAKGLTFKEFFSGKVNVYPGYAPAADKNDPDKYATFVVKAFPGATIDTIIESLIDINS